MSVILAIDLGKFNSVFCWYDPANKSATFRTVRAGEAEFREDLLRQPVVGCLRAVPRNRGRNLSDTQLSADEVPGMARLVDNDFRHFSARGRPSVGAVPESHQNLRKPIPTDQVPKARSQLRHLDRLVQV